MSPEAERAPARASRRHRPHDVIRSRHRAEPREYQPM